MAYSNFTLPDVLRAFHLSLAEVGDLYVAAPEVQPSALLLEVLAENVPLALAIHTEKARSEMIVVPILIELRKLFKHQISLFSGTEFTVEPEAGLSGTCDFLISRSSQQLLVVAPVLAIVEAKKDDVKAGLGQCVASLVAAQRFNAEAQTGVGIVHGIVTTGSIWKPLHLDGPIVRIDQGEYFLDRPAKILGILSQMVA